MQLGAEILAVGDRFGFLASVEAVRDRMMRVLDLHHKIGDRELKLVRPQAVARCRARDRAAAPDIAGCRRSGRS